MDWHEYMINASKLSHDDASLWFRYLRKVIFEDDSHLTNSDIEKLLDSEELTYFQKLSLRYAMREGTLTHDYVVSLNKSAKLSNISKMLAKYKIERQDRKER